ncbi:MAG: NF038122 family metalloprotease [Acidobacteriota bacterium]
MRVPPALVALVALFASVATSAPALEPRVEILERGGGGLSCRSASAPERAALTSRQNASPVHVLARSRESLPASAGLHIVLRGTDQLEAHSEAKAAFLRAAARWESLLASPVTIVIDVDYGKTYFGTPFTNDTIAGFTTNKFVGWTWNTTRAKLLSPASGKAALYASMPVGPVPTDLGAVTQLYASMATFRAIGLSPAVEDPNAEQATFGNPTRIAFREFTDIDFDPSDGIAIDKTDFDFLAMHEIGHALGFESYVGGNQRILSLMDLFRFRPAAGPPSLATAPRVLTVGGEQTFFSADSQIALSNSDPADFGAPHWKSAIFTGRTIGIMEPLELSGARGVVTSRDLAVLDAIGWKIAGPAPVEPSVRTIPIVLDAAGVGGVRFSTELTITNRSMAPADAELSYTSAAFLGASGAGAATITLPALSQLLIPDALQWLRDHGVAVPASGNQGGTLKVTFRGDATPDSFYTGARTTSPAGGGRAGLAYPAIREFDGLKGRGYVFGLRESAADRSNLALLNMGASPVTLRVTLRPGSGGAAFTLPDVSLDAGQWTQLSRVLGGPGFVSGWATIDLVAGSGPYAAYGVFNDNATNDGSFVPAVADPLTAEPQLVPVVVETATFSSELVLTNPSNSASSVTLSYVESASPAAGAGGNAAISLGPGEQKILPAAVDWLRTHGATIGPKGAASYVGTVTAAFSSAGAAGAGLAGARTSAPGDGGAYGLFTPAIGLSGGFIWDTWVFGLKQDSSSRSNLAVINVGDGHAPLTLHVEVLDGPTGALAGRTSSFTLAPGGWKQFDGILSSFGVTNGYARIVYDDGRGSFFAYGVVNDGATPTSGGTNDGSYIAASKR